MELKQTKIKINLALNSHPYRNINALYIASKPPPLVAFKGWLFRAKNKKKGLINMQPTEYAPIILKIQETKRIIANTFKELATIEPKIENLKKIKSQREKLLKELEEYSTLVTNHFVKVQHNGRH